jgi:hypothetical protein
LWQKRIMVATGKRSIWSVGQDQMQPIIGRKYQSRKARRNHAVQEVADGLLQRGLLLRLGDLRGQRLKRSMSASMPRKRGRHQVAALGEHGVEVAAAPFQALAAGHLHRERHVRRRGVHAQLGEQLAPAAGRCAWLKTRKPVSTPWVDAVQRDVHRVGVAAEAVVGLEQRDLGLVARCQAAASPEMPEPTTATRRRVRWGPVMRRSGGAGGKKKAPCGAPGERGREGGGGELPTSDIRKAARHAN